MTFNLNALSNWHAALVGDTLRIDDGATSKGILHQLTFGDGGLHSFRLTLDPTSELCCGTLSFFLSSGHMKAGDRRTSQHLSLRPVKSVAVRQRDFDKFGNPFFIITIKPGEGGDPLTTSFPPKDYAEPPGKIKKD